MSETKTKPEYINYSRFSWAFILAAVVVMMPELSYATGGAATPLGDTICTVVVNLQGDIARGVAAVGIIFLGFSLFLGKVTWGVALALGIGIGAIFGAAELVKILGNTADNWRCAGVS